MEISSEKKLLTNESCLFFWKNTDLSDKREQQLSANINDREVPNDFNCVT